MDRNEEDMKSMGFVGIFKQSFKTILSCKKLFTQITLSLIIPLTVIFLGNLSISNHLFYRIETNTLTFNINTNGQSIYVIDWLFYWLFKFAYFSILTVLSLLSTAAVVFTIACVFTSRDITFQQVIKVIPKIWKKLFVTFVYIYLSLFIYNVIYSVTLILCGSLFGESVLGLMIIIKILILYLLGFLYLIVIWQLASVVTILENVYGYEAMKKGKNLLNGKKNVGMGIAFVLYGKLFVLVTVYGLFVDRGNELFGLVMIWRVVIGILIGISVMILFLLVIVIQTVLYLVCKSYHGEAIDKLSLSTFLGEEIQLGRTQVEEV